MKLLLTSNGIKNPELEQAFSELIGGRKDLKMALIPTAGDPIEWKPSAIPGGHLSDDWKLVTDTERLEKNKKWHEEWRKNVEDKGYKAYIVDLKDDPAIVKKLLSDADIINVSGGDGNYLMDQVKASGLDKYLKDLLNKGIVYLGTSAGSNLVTPSIGLGWWKPEETLEHKCLGIVDFCLAVHQKEDDDRSETQKIIDYKMYLQSVIEYPWKVYLLKDGQAIKVDGDNIEHIGPGVKKSI